MKKNITMLSIIAMSAAMLAVSGCCGSGSCPFRGGKKAGICAGCGASKGSAECAAACKTPVEKCPKCGMPKGSPGCCADEM
jgi:hypothetical protein